MPCDPGHLMAPQWSRKEQILPRCFISEVIAKINEPPEVLSPLVSVFSALSIFQVCVLVSHMLHVWYIYLYLGDFWGKCW